ncbi:MAG: response regulator [Polyangiales bacterium]|nr:response regulator [Myxococcales bacterium]
MAGLDLDLDLVHEVHGAEWYGVPHVSASGPEFEYDAGSMLTDARASALGSARSKFVDALPRKAAELMSSVELVAEVPDAERHRDDLRRRLHALYASAQVFRLDPLAEALKAAIENVDSARENRRRLGDDDFAALRRLAHTLPDLGRAAESSESTPPAKPSDPAPAPMQSTGEAAGATASDADPSKDPKVRTMPFGLSGASPDVEPIEVKGPPREAHAAEAAPASDPTRGYESFTAAPVTSESVRVPSPSGLAAYAMLSDPAALRDAPTPNASLPPVVLKPTALAEVMLTERQTTALQRASAPTVPPGSVSKNVCSVLLIDDRGELASVRVVLPSDNYEVSLGSSMIAALELAQTGAPDVILAEASFLEERAPEFVKELRATPTTAFIPLVVVYPSGTDVTPERIERSGGDAGIERPIEADLLQGVLLRVSGLESQVGFGSSPPDGMTTEEIADQIAREIRRGLVESAEHGFGVRLSSASASSAMAATWDAIAQIRADLERRSGGKLTFRDAVGRGGPRLVAMGAPESTVDDALFEGMSLVGRHVVVAEDQPEVLDGFVRVLEDAGVRVTPCENGEEALAAVRSDRVDAVVSDVLMPELDGFGLCRALQADPVHADIPVILLSWREDLLVRMRQLQAGAAGYVTKDGGGADVVRALKRALWPRERLQAALAGGAEVRGRVEDVGLTVLLRLVAWRRSRARVEIRELGATFEMEFRGGRLLSVSRVRSNGERLYGQQALDALVNVRAGRYLVHARIAAERRLSDEVRVPMEASSAEARAFLEAIELNADRGLEMEIIHPEDLEARAAAEAAETSEGESTGRSRAASVEPAQPTSVAALAFMLVVCVGCGWVLWQFWQAAVAARDGGVIVAPAGTRVRRGIHGVRRSPVRRTAVTVVAAAPEAVPEHHAAAPLDPIDGRLVAGVTDSLQVHEREGVLAIAQGTTEDRPRVRVDGHDVGAPPLDLVLAEGRHVIAFLHGDEVRYRVWYVPRGHTRTVLSP